MTKNHNHRGYQVRLDFVQTLLCEEFGILRDAEISPIQYEEDFPFKYNNFVYRVTLKTPITANQISQAATQRPGCVPVPEGTKEFIVRLANPDAEGMHRATRIENEVAIISLAAAALKDIQPHVVPSVYAWDSAAAETSHGWIIQEFMPGAPVYETFPQLDLEPKKEIIAQMVKLLKALQDYELPTSITGFGGVTFDKDGQIVSAAMPTVGKGPWPSYEAAFRERIEVALEKADASPHIRGWRENGIRERLDAFVERGLAAQFASFATKDERTIIHADFNASNIMFDPSTYRITALIDYDFSTISHPSYEFLRSFLGVGGQFRGWCGEESGEEAALTEARLYSFPSPLPQSTKKDGGVDWELSKVLEDELEKLDVKRPRTMKGIEKIADVDTVLRTILPWRLSNTDILGRQSESVLAKCRQENEEQMSRLLSYLGF